jgi:hypothetical protein
MAFTINAVEQSSADDGSSSGMTTQPPKDFLALSHGHEWVSFYESFDKLVQDHLSRSSELLRKAMSLPEVADREVAQIRDDLETRLTAERDHNTQTLHALKQDIATSHKQVVTLAQMIGSLMTDFDRLASSVDDAIAKTAEMTTAPAAAGDVEMAGEAPADQRDEPAAENPSWSEPASLLDDDAESAEEIDLNALAAAEAETNHDHPAVAATPEPNGADRVRPHWLSMARTNTN